MSNNRKHVLIRGGGRGAETLRDALPAESIECSLGELAYGESRVPDLVVWFFEDGDSSAVIAQTESAPVLAVADETRFLEMIDAGCLGFALHHAPTSRLVSAVERVLAGHAEVPPELLGQLLRHVVEKRRNTSQMLSKLTEREREVFELATRGANKDEIGEELFISPATARTHLQRVYRKLEVHSQTELMALTDRATEKR